MYSENLFSSNKYDFINSLRNYERRSCIFLSELKFYPINLLIINTEKNIYLD